MLMLAAGAMRPASAQVLNFRNYTGADGLPQAQVLGLHQDPHGYIWVGTYGGLSRFNGYDFTTYTTDSGLTSNAIEEIRQDAEGRLIIGTLGGGVCIGEQRSFRCMRMTDGLPDDDVHSIALDGRGGAWLATKGGVSYMRDGAFRNYTKAEGLPSNITNRVAMDSTGGVWAATDLGLARLVDGRFVAQDASVIGSVPIRMLLPTPRGLLVGAQSGLFLHAAEGTRRLLAETIPPGTIFTDAARDASGVVWITTRTGVLRYDGEDAEWLTHLNGLLFDQVIRVMVDREGNVWFGTESGISKLVPGPFKQYTENEGLPNPFVRAITRGPDGRTWVGTRDGVAVYENGRFHAVDLHGALADRRVYSLAAQPDGSMLIGTRQGLAHLSGGRVRLYRRADGLPNEFVLSILPDPAGGAWIGTPGGVAHWRDGRIEPAEPALLRDLPVSTMAYDARGRIWIGRRSGGVMIVDGGHLKTLGPAEGLTDQTIWSITRDRQGRMWIGSNGDGAFRVSGDTVRQFTQADGLANDFIWQVFADSRGRIWLYSSRGLDRFDGRTFTHFGRGSGLVDLEGSATAAAEDANGNLWFGAGSGVTRYDVSAPEPPPVDLEAYIEQISVGGRPLSLSDARIQPHAGVVKISFASPTFRDESAVRFRYRLLPTATEWSEPTAEHGIGYAGLAPGHYEFQLIAQTDEGVTSAAATIPFTMLPAFWQTLWFRILGLVLLAGITSAIPYLRARHLERERQRLETVIAVRTRELEQNNLLLRREVTERMNAESALRSSEQRIRDIVEHTTNLFYSRTPEGELTYVSPQARRFFGREPDAAARWNDFLSEHPVNVAGRDASERAIATGEQQPPYPLQLSGGNGSPLWVEVNEAPLVRDGRTVAIVGSLTDTTEARQAQEEHDRLEAQLRQAQKMEAVGRLAGGIAHDFNNLLTSVVGNTELIADELGEGHPVNGELSEIRRAAERAAALVAQLLAFSRQQVIRRRIVDLNTLVRESARMLRRMIGEDITLELDLADDLGRVAADQAQVDQIVMNLAVNARDAMPTGGRLSIETSNRSVQPGLREHTGEEIEPGEYVLLRIGDSGHGMDAETLAQAFEPFFTTKEVGKGTGLGLATVYGIVKQNGGYVLVNSEPTRGTAFSIYLPRSVEEESAPEPFMTQPAAVGEDRVVLVVEDEDAVRGLVCRTLSRYGFRILEAANGESALEIANEYPDRIHLLLSDVVMPGLNGKMVAERITAERADTSVLFMSGHPRDALGSRYMLDDATELIQKPFTPNELAERVRLALAL